MVAFETFRRDFAGLLQAIADDRRHAVAGRPACGEELKIIALFERLSQETAALNPAVHRVCEERLDGVPLARAFARRRDDLMGQVGTIFWPRGVDDLVSWLTDQMAAAPNPGGSGSGAPPRPVSSWSLGGAGGVAVKAPLLALWASRSGRRSRGVGAAP